jgi:hypothetical protein
MPPSKKALRNNEKKLNKKLGIGDKDGKVMRQKEVTAMISCTICGTSVKPTKTNSEIKAHAGKEGKSIEECFPGATKVMEEMLAHLAGGKKKGGKGGKGGKGKKMEQVNLFDAPKVKKKKKKKVVEEKAAEVAAPAAAAAGGGGEGGVLASAAAALTLDEAAAPKTA